MKNRFLTLALSAILSCGVISHAGVERLTPKPAQLTQGTGELALPSGLNIGYQSDLSADMISEITGFATALNTATGLNATANSGSGLINVSVDPSLPAEGYKLDITTSGANIAAATPAGLYYAFQTVKKLLPPNVSVGVAGAAGAAYTLPVVNITDSPRFSYRGFMLDVSRHFFDAAQVKKMLDIMAVYKLNRFHWHLTDDQGWRLPVAKYPKLTVEGATNKDVQLTNFETQTKTYAGENVIYGPYAYTVEEIKDIVAYAKARHIEVIPEIDMPGHMVAAIHAYPEFSTDPENKNNVHADMDHEIWNRGGVSRDVLDVSNPAVMQFVKDVIDVLAELFPYEYIHIGGDECPTLAWEKSENCQKFMAEHNLSNERAIQSWFVKQIADYARTTHSRKIMGWNEIITDGGVDMNMINEIKPTIFCWTGGEGKAQANGLDHIYTGFNGGYYINRSYAGFDKVGAVGDGALATTLTVNPPLNSHCIGVQGTFWTEQVDRPTDLEYLALPRLIGIAEQGWAPVDKDYEEIMARLIADKELLEIGGYNYGKHQLVMPTYKKPEAGRWYKIASNASDERNGNVWEVLAAGHQLITDKAGKGAKANRLWGAKSANDNDYQLFRFVEDPANEGRYAIVCKALPEGSLSSTPTGTGLGDRWDYTATGLDYGFVLDKAYYHETDNSDEFRYAIRPHSLAAGYYMNFARDGQGQAVNVYNNPNDGNGGHMIFKEVNIVEPPVIDNMPEDGVYYRLHTRFNGPDSQARFGSVIELLRDDAGKGNNAKADRLWSNAPAASTDANFAYQCFKFEADPAGSGYYAMVCKAKPEGSVNSTPAESTNSNTARWDYDNNTKHYGFTLVKEYNGQATQGIDDSGYFYSAITSKDAAQGWYMNTSAAGQGFSIHLWNNPLDQNAGLYTFEAQKEQSGIANIEQQPIITTNCIYDLQGRRLNAPVKGVNIINGHKVLVK